jgi:hypothetical protein
MVNLNDPEVIARVRDEMDTVKIPVTTGYLRRKLGLCYNSINKVLFSLVLNSEVDSLDAKDVRIFWLKKYPPSKLGKERP